MEESKTLGKTSKRAFSIDDHSDEEFASKKEAKALKTSSSSAEDNDSATGTKVSPPLTVSFNTMVKKRPSMSSTSSSEEETEVPKAKAGFPARKTPLNRPIATSSSSKESLSSPDFRVKKKPPTHAFAADSALDYGEEILSVEEDFEDDESSSEGDEEPPTNEGEEEGSSGSESSYGLTKPANSPSGGVAGTGREEDDIVLKGRKKRNLHGLLSHRAEDQGSKGSMSDPFMTSSSEEEGTLNAMEEEDGGEVENLFDDTLEEINAALEVEQRKRSPVQMLQHSKTSASSMSDGGHGATSPLRTMREVLRDVPFFSQFSSEHQEQLFQELQEEVFQDGVDIVRQGELGDKFYVIVDGEAVVSKFSNETKQMRDLTHIYTGDYFGELVLIYGGERVATVTSCGNTKCLSLSKKSFEKYTHIRYFLIMQKVPLLAKLSREVQLEIITRLKPVIFNKDDVVVNQGDKGDAFFLITRGSALVVDEDENKIITHLYEGHSFGEMALLSDAPRVASVRAASELHCMFLTVEDFKELMSADDFAILLQDESNKIRELRGKRMLFKQMRANSESFPMLELSFSSQQDEGEGESFSRPRTSSSSYQLHTPNTPRTTAGTHTKLKTGKTPSGSRLINNYMLLEQIGKGTFGIVRLCENILTHERFAIKIIDKGLFKNKIASKHQSTIDDMRREASIMKKLNHPNVVHLIDVIDDPKADKLYLIQEYCARGAIMENLEGNTPFEEDLARKYFRQLLSGIDYLHAHHIIHRDIKPMNLLLTAEGVVKIGDFGAARVLQGGSNQTLGIAGTPAFMAPELLGQEASLYDGPAVDLWSCGATLFMLVTGEPPWMADDEVVLSKKVQNDELVFPGTFSTKLSPHLRNLLTRVLVKDPLARMTLTDAMTHEWVTEEGADEMERFVNLQPKLIRVNSKRLIHSNSSSPSAAMGKKLSSPKNVAQEAAPAMELVPTLCDAAAAVLLAAAEDTSSSEEENPISTLQSSSYDTPVAKSMQRKRLGSEEKEESVHVVDEEMTTLFSTRAPTLERLDSVMDYTQFDVGKGGMVRPFQQVSPMQQHQSPRATALFALPNGGLPPALSSSSSKKKKLAVDAFVQNKQAKFKIRRQTSASSRSSVGSPEQSPRSPQLFRRIRNSKPTAVEGNKLRRGSANLLVTTAAREEEDLPTLLPPATPMAVGEFSSYATKPIPRGVIVRAKRGYPVSHCGLRFGYAENQGLRQSMEDCIAIVPKMRNPDTFYAGIFDGHNGDMVSRELKARLHGALSASPDFPTNLAVAFRKTCLKVDRAMLHFAATELLEIQSKISNGDQQKSLVRTKGGGSKVDNGDAYRKAGSTAVVAMVRGTQLTVGWVGDSRAVLCRAGLAIELSQDHKASREDEKQRIRDNQGTVDRQGRLNGDLAVSRAFGDLQHKGRELPTIVQQGAEDEEEEEFGSVGTLIALPDIVDLTLSGEDEFVVLASDGVWDVMTNEEVVGFVRFHLHRHGDPRKAATELVDKALEVHSLDNVSAVILAFGGKF